MIELQAVLKDTLPNIIAISWQSHAGDAHLQVPRLSYSCGREAFAAAVCPRPQAIKVASALAVCVLLTWPTEVLAGVYLASPSSLVGIP